ncbi:hypothetical protein MNBD_CPR01-373 [hydrothermal vent metagenome]|uniref:Uncharacterized protein n=1 Tax=hydrothermal vent metagenome TaxID=652676 RepID=A0A3B0UPA7_9ZZZZ|nr:hypothetical protein [Candidatus Kaiserbacteria bacterium]
MHNFKKIIIGAIASPVRPLLILVGFLLVGYIGLLATVMTYGVLQMQSAEAMRDMSAKVATLDAEYFSTISTINKTDLSAQDFVKPISVAYVEGTQTAVSMRTQ